jgi:cytochrome P450
MEATLPTFILFKHFSLFRKTILSLPPWLAIRASPETAGLTQLNVILEKQVKEVTTNPESLKDQPHPIIYHRLLDPEAQKGHPIPNATSLYEEAQALMFGGGETVVNTLMVGVFHILSQSSLHERLRREVLEVWPRLDSPPMFETLETLPLLTGAIKEALRMSPGVCSPCLRKVPATGATICNLSIPGGTIVGMSGVFVHNSSKIFTSPESLDADRWLANDAKSLDQWLVAFSNGPRSCLGISLAWCEMYIAFATMLRRFDMRIDGTTLEDLVWRDCFIPHFYGRHLQAWCQPVAT